MFKPGRIVLEWTTDGRLNVNAPLGDKETCYQMLAEAIAMIARQGEKKILTPAEFLPLKPGA